MERNQKYVEKKIADEAKRSNKEVGDEKDIHV